MEKKKKKKVRNSNVTIQTWRISEHKMKWLCFFHWREIGDWDYFREDSKLQKFEEKKCVLYIEY